MLKDKPFIYCLKCQAPMLHDYIGGGFLSCQGCGDIKDILGVDKLVFAKPINQGSGKEKQV